MAKGNMELSRILAKLALVGLLGNVYAQILVPQTEPYANDENTVLLEHFDGSNTGSPNGGISYSSGVFGQGIRLDSSSWVSWPLGGFPNGTVEFWGKLNSFDSAGGAPDFVWAYLSPNLIGGGPGSTLIVNVVANDSPGFHAGQPTAGVHNGGTWLHTATNSVTITANIWHHYALTWGEKGLRFYVDGALVGTNNAGGLNPSTSVWLIGNANRNGFDGVLDELRISNVQRSFTATDVPRLSIEVAGVRLRWPTQAGALYEIQYSTAFQGWTPLKTVGGTGGIVEQVDAIDGVQRYYRLVKK